MHLKKTNLHECGILLIHATLNAIFERSSSPSGCCVISHGRATEDG
jgi:hypothetical protein